jgi:hypothetical protein
VEAARDVESLLREILLEFRFSSGNRRSRRLRELLQNSLGRMPGLMETEFGRDAAMDYILAVAALFRWGGKRSVEQLIAQVESLYRADRGDTGRELTRRAILPLAESMLMLDLPHLASVAIGLDHRRRLRRRLGVRTGRGDRLEVVYIIKGDLVLFRRRIRVQLPAPASLLRLLAGLGRRLPLSMRGSSADRQRRTMVMDAVQKAIRESGSSDGYAQWCECFDRLHQIALEGRFHEVPLRELEATLPFSTSS